MCLHYADPVWAFHEIDSVNTVQIDRIWHNSQINSHMERNTSDPEVPSLYLLILEPLCCYRQTGLRNTA